MSDELIFGLIAPLGAPLRTVEAELTAALSAFGFNPTTIHLGQELAEIYAQYYPGAEMAKRLIDERLPALERKLLLQDAGDALRIDVKRGDLLAILAIAKLAQLRRENLGKPRAYLIHSLKHPSEVQLLRAIYRERFFTVAAFSSRNQRIEHLGALEGGETASFDRARALVERDYRRGSRQPTPDRLDDLVSQRWFSGDRPPRSEGDLRRFGQQLQQTFHLADLFVDLSDRPLLNRQIKRFVDLIFGHRFTTPTQAEFAMFQAKTVSLRSADLARQVGAVIASKSGAIIASGVNEVPKFGGGLAWPSRDLSSQGDHRDFRFYADGDVDALRVEKTLEVFEELEAEGWRISPPEARGALSSAEAAREFAQRLRQLHLPESGAYGRAVHAEMAALMDAVSRGVCVRGQVMFATTFPCHQCVKHLLAAGIERVVFIEPYPKSLAARLWPSEIAEYEIDGSSPSGKLLLQPFVGIAPERYMEFFLHDRSRPPRRQVSQGRRYVASWVPRAPMGAVGGDALGDRDRLADERHLLQQWESWFAGLKESKRAALPV